MTVIITGINGFVGKHLARELRQNKAEVIGVGYDGELDPSLSGLVKSYYQADLTRTWPQMPAAEAVIHLAGLAAVGPSFDQPQKYIEANSSMVTNMCEHYLKSNDRPRIVLISSGAIYDSFQPMPLAEDSALGFNSPYGLSKILNENQAKYYQKRGLDMVIARPFNHVGPGQLPGFLVPDLVQQIKAARENGSKLKVGNLKTKRDYSDVRDVARAYYALATASKLDSLIYNVCSGQSRSGQKILDYLLDIMDAKNIEVEVDQSKIRPNDPVDIYGSAEQLKRDTGWQPRLSIEQTLKDSV